MKDQLSEGFINLPNNKKLLVIVGPTASGKTELALKLAKKYNGELLSADSRQIYRGLDIGTGKDIKNFQFSIFNFQISGEKIGYYQEPKSFVKIWGLDLINPNQSFSVAQWVELAKLIIIDIQKRNKLPIIVGGTGFWVKALLEGIPWGRVPPNGDLRLKIYDLRIEELQKKLKAYPKKFWDNLTQSDWKNKRRLIRRIEVAAFSQRNPKANVAIKGIERDLKIKIIQLCPKIYDLRFKINERIEKRLKQGLLEEIKSLLNKGYTFSDLGMNTLGYKEFREYFTFIKCHSGLDPESIEIKTILIDSRLRGNDNKNTQKLLSRAIEQWKKDEMDYARRQMLWNKKYFRE
jgi:tRNA dimethylallyltransferase